MDTKDLTLKLPLATVAALKRLAEQDYVTPGQLIRDAVERELRRRASAKTPVRADERLVAPLRALLANDFAYAQGWQDLQSRLIAKGYRLAESGGGLVLITHPQGERLCKGSELGHSYSALLRKFHAPFPGHSQAWQLRVHTNPH
ncbi:MAG: CopG family transcriptional regulator [Pseudotabrizicola sp.]|uniref:ribbon-helix-helix domain-containing protein n=1 Tax=Pseudotabrizicola sp. TaxID=2939647 RepID=UPI00271F316A|nr:CopG family transcriptional regulator [Pseudotabrizicola sp.]MDO9637182.1 CopG family transcriptional regulator [Pseudotabrizicola sp.]